uniref:CCHC-type domain-containing protein n=1 Tax=Peronospora matthiolae TaxID=2874970 RepID=A0AAV1UIL9_9STRA
MGIHAVSVMLEALNRDAQHATIAKFIQNELDAERENVALLHQQGSRQSELLREQVSQQFELLRQQQAAAGGSMHLRRPETLKIDISKYRGVEEDSLLRWFVKLDDAIRARRIDDGDMQVTFAQSNLAVRAKTWALGLKLHDPYAFGSLEVFKSRLRQTFEPPRAEFRARTELLKLKQDSLEQAISIAEQEDFILRQARASSTSYLPPRRYDSGGPEPMELCYVESEKARSTDYKKLQKCNRCQKTGHYAYECSAPRPVSRDTGRNDRPPMKKGQGRGSAVGAKTQQRDGPSNKRTGSVGAEHPTGPATSREFVGLLMKVAPNTQTLCVAALGNEISLITLKLEVTNELSLRALVDCGASNNFVRRQSLEDGHFKFSECDTPPTRMTVRLTTGASVTVMKRSVKIHYALEDTQYDDDFVELDLDANLMSSLEYRGSEGTNHGLTGNIEQ